MRASRRSCASACFSAALVVACTRGTGDVPRRDGDASFSAGSAEPLGYAPVASRPSPERVGDESVGRRAGSTPALSPFESIAAVKSIGHTSFVLKVTLADGEVGAFKPRSKRPLGDRRYRGEIAAYRLARALGLDNVPPAVARAFPLAALREACSPAPACSEQIDREAIVDPDGTLRGAFIQWIDDYRVLPLEEATWHARWEPWVIDPRASIPRDERALASALSTLIAFDFLTANWDRWSGGNVARDGAAGALLYVDNDGAFYEHPRAEVLARQLAFLRRVVRFSRRFLSSLRALDEPKLNEVFGDEPPGEPLLAPHVVAAVEERRRLVIQAVDARLARAGERATLSFE
jgi:hypothetical protein